MKVTTFNRVISVLMILFLGYSIVCAILASRLEPMGDMPWYVIVWLIAGLCIIVWALYYGNKSEKQVYYLDESEEVRSRWPGLTEEEINYNGPDYPDDVPDSAEERQKDLDEMYDILRSSTGCTTVQATAWIRYEDLMKNDPMFRGKRCTCLDCDWQTNNCQFAFDPYNTDGDCLAIK
jgi:hypothetical protein